MSVKIREMHVTAEIEGMMCEAVASFVRYTFGEVAHWMVGLGCNGQLLAVYTGVTHRGMASVGGLMREQIHGLEAPSDVRKILGEKMASIIDADWRAQ